MSFLRPAALLFACFVLVPVPAGAEEPGIPALAAVNTVTAVGAASIDVTLPGEASFVQRLDAPRASGWADITTTGTFAAVAIVSKNETMPGGSVPVNAFELHLVAPDACSGDAAPAAARLCLDPYRHTLFQSPTPPQAVQGKVLYPYAPGEYTIYLVTDPGATVTATFELVGPEGSRELVASAPVAAQLDRVRDESPALASLNGSHTHVFEEPGLAVIGFYFVAAAPGVPGALNYSECLTRGTPGPASPNECIPAVFLGQDVTVAGQPVVVRPVTGALHGGAWTLENSGMLTPQSPTLSPGLYTNTFRVQRGGPGPAVGAWAFWLEY